MDSENTDVAPPADPPPAEPPADQPAPPPTPPATGQPGNSGALEDRLASLETLARGLSETVAGLLPKDKRPVKRPWTHWGSDK